MVVQSLAHKRINTRTFTTDKVALAVGEVVVACPAWKKSNVSEAPLSNFMQEFKFRVLTGSQEVESISDVTLVADEQKPTFLVRGRLSISHFLS